MIELVVVTWLGLVSPMEQHFPTGGWSHCEKRLELLQEVYTKARTLNPEFGFILSCEKKPERPKKK